MRFIDSREKGAEIKTERCFLTHEPTTRHFDPYTERPLEGPSAMAFYLCDILTQSLRIVCPLEKRIFQPKNMAVRYWITILPVQFRSDWRCDVSFLALLFHEAVTFCPGVHNKTYIYPINWIFYPPVIYFQCRRSIYIEMWHFISLTHFSPHDKQ
jgi:hypothetical protein